MQIPNDTDADLFSQVHSAAAADAVFGHSLSLSVSLSLNENRFVHTDFCVSHSLL